MNRLTFWLLLLILPALARCRGMESQADPSASPASQGSPPGFTTVTSPDASADSGQGDAPAFVHLVRVKLTTVEVPVGTVSGSEELWSYLDEERAKAARSSALGRNGLRVGVAPADTWSDLATVLKKQTGRRMIEQDMLASPGSPIPIELKGSQEAATIFTCYQNRTVSGADYPEGDYLLTLTCTMDEDDPSRMIVTGVPQIRSTARNTGYARDSVGRLSPVSEPTVFNFEPVAFQLRMSSREILVIGPGAESRRPSSVAHHFLLSNRNSVEFENVLVLVPEVVRAPVKRTIVSPEGS